MCIIRYTDYNYCRIPAIFVVLSGEGEATVQRQGRCLIRCDRTGLMLILALLSMYQNVICQQKCKFKQ